MPANPKTVAAQRLAYDAALRASVARKNRAAAPDAAAFVDEVRKHFPGAVVTYYVPARKRCDPRYDS